MRLFRVRKSPPLKALEELARECAEEAEIAEAEARQHTAAAKSWRVREREYRKAAADLALIQAAQEKAADIAA